MEEWGFPPNNIIPVSLQVMWSVFIIITVTAFGLQNSCFEGEQEKRS